MLDSPVFGGRLVRLEPLSLDHLAGLVKVAAGPRDSFVYTQVPDGEESMRSYIETALAWHAAGTAVPYVTFDRRSGRIAGCTRFFDIQYWHWDEGNPNQRGAELPDALEIGYTWLAPWAQRSGINTEAKLLMLTHAFETWRVHRVRLTTDERNARSRAAIERLGAKLDGVLRAASAGYDGNVRSSAYYSMLDSEWPSVKAALTERLR